VWELDLQMQFFLIDLRLGTTVVGHSTGASDYQSCWELQYCR
jgi:hypothetical protein